MSLGTMALVAVATWQFGVIGATGAAVFGALAMHGTRFYLARRLGCPYGFEAGVLWGMGTVLFIYLMTYRLGLPFPAKIILAAAVMTVLWIKIAPLLSWQAMRQVLGRAEMKLSPGQSLKGDDDGK
jgi:hypothetical protein